MRRHHYQDTICKRAFAVVCTLMVWQTMVSHIPFKNAKPIINIPPMHVTTKLVTFTKSSGAGQFYIKLVAGSYQGLRERITEVASAQATTMDKTKPFGPCWRFIWLISIALIPGPASMDPEISLSKWLWKFLSGVADMGRPNLIMLMTVISELAKAFPEKTDRIPPPEKVQGMAYDQILAALRLGAPKLAWLKQYLRNTLMAKDNAEKVIMWVYWPLTQWLVEQVSTPFTFPHSATHISSDIWIWCLTLTSTLRMTMILTCAQYCRVLGYNSFAIYRSMSADARASVKKSFINCRQVRVLVLSYLTNNEGLILHYNCRNSVTVEQGINYSMEH